MNCAEKSAHDLFYQQGNDLHDIANNSAEYITWYRNRYLEPFYQGGITKGYVRGLAVQSLLDAISGSGLSFGDVTVLDAGCGQGGLSVYLAALGMNVIAVDLSTVACKDGHLLSEKIGVEKRCRFYDTSLASIPIGDHTVDFIIGHASLHHFIKYREIIPEFTRISKPSSVGFFADAYGENKLYHIFHNKEQMNRLGDVSLTLSMVEDYFSPSFSVEMQPTDWFAMLDKLWLKFTPKSAESLLRKISYIHHSLDRMIPFNSRFALRCSGSALTIIKRSPTA